MHHYLRKKTMTLSKHNTSIALEPRFWEVIACIAHWRKITLTELISEIDNTRPFEQSLSSAIRITCLNWIIHHRKELDKLAPKLCMTKQTSFHCASS